MIGILITIVLSLAVGIAYACCIASSDWQEIEEEKKKDERSDFD